ncbi:MAG: hypothetical protein OEY97_12885 [Nitrospirota bacterium]|nr:hypothetical protein [Nitrospirota bacterium]
MRTINTTNCCTPADWSCLTDQVNLDVQETETGVTVQVTAKDPEKTGALKDLARGLKSFCQPGCC